MADNYETNAGSGGLTFRSFDDGTVQWPAGVCAWATTVGTPDVLVPVTLANGLPVQPGTSTTWAVTDNSGSLTVDAPVGTPVFVRLSDGASAISTLPVSLASVPSHPVTNAGTFAVQESGQALIYLQTISQSINLQGTEYLSEINVTVIGGVTGQVSGTVYGLLVDTSGRAQVSVATALPAGDNNIGNVDVASIAAGTNYIGKVRLTDGTNDTSLLNLTNSKPLPVAIVDGDGSQLTSFGGGTQYTEGATDASITGTAILWENTSDTLATVSASTPLPVAIISGAGSGGTASDDDADFTAGTTAGTPAMGVYESSPSSVTDGDMGIVGITETRRLKTSATIDAALPAGTNAIGKLAANTGVDIGDVDVTSVIPGTGATNLGKARDSAVGSTDTGVAPLVLRDDTLDTVSAAEGDYEVLRANSAGALWVALNGTATVSGTVTANAGTNLNTSALALESGGNLATAATLLGTIDADTSALAGAVSGSEVQVDVVGALPAGTNLIGNVGTVPVTSGGCSAYSAISTAAVLAAEIKGSAGQVYGIQAFNLNAAARYVRIYNQTGAPADTDAANIVWRGIIPGNTAGAGFSIPLPGPIACGTGIGIRASGAIADNDTTALAANELIFNVQYK